MQIYKISDRLWSRFGVDLFIFQFKDYIVLVDYYFDFVEVSSFKDVNSKVIIKFMKVQFSRYGIFDVFVLDNGLQFISREFVEFVIQWEFQYVILLLYYLKFNGKVELVVKIVKGLFKKVNRDNKDLWFSFLDYRNIFIVGIQISFV